jgi:RNA polymerase sigma factor (sigma-70 family)
METITNENSNLVGNAYVQYHDTAVNFIAARVKDTELAKDMAQDVFVRLMGYNDMLQSSTIKSFIFTIAQNIVIDHFRRNCKRMEIHSYIYDRSETADNMVFERIFADNMQSIEQDKIKTLPKMRRTVYCMARFDDKSAEEIASELSLSRRTVESHLLMGRKEVREYMAHVCG